VFIELFESELKLILKLQFGQSLTTVYMYVKF